MLKKLLLLAALIGAVSLTASRSFAAESHGATPAAPEVEKAHDTATGGAHDAGGATHEGGHKVYGLLPEPADPQTWYAALWVVIIFVILLAILYPTAWKNVLAGLRAREEGIRKNIADAEAQRARAEATLKEYNKQLATAEARVRDMITQATAQGEKILADIKMRAQQEVEEIKTRSTREIEAARKQALTEIYEKTAELSTAIAQQILQRQINVDDQRDFVRQSLAQLTRAN
ncbi:MAG: F0F1 ATP synthase subunit B [Tepidisphaeraceae bacterium]|jgi:F-type H+-transporting ATPase subunit b